MKLSAFKLLFVGLALAAVFAVGGTAHALQEGDNNGGPSGTAAPVPTTSTTAPAATTNKCTQSALLPDLFKDIRDPNTCEVQVSSFASVGLLLRNVVTALLSLAGIVAAALIIAGGFMYIASNGEASGIKRAKDTILNALLGLVIILVAIGLVNFVSGQFK